MSLDKLGIDLSAFNLKIEDRSIECIYQESKIFKDEFGYEKKGNEIIYESGYKIDDSRAAKKAIKEFCINNKNYNLDRFYCKDLNIKGSLGDSSFYDFLCCKGLWEKCDKDKNCEEKLRKYNIFTDIRSNIGTKSSYKAFNSQARSCAIFTWILCQKNELEKYMKNIDYFKKIYKFYRVENSLF